VPPVHAEPPDKESSYPGSGSQPCRKAEGTCLPPTTQRGSRNSFADGPYSLHNPFDESMIQDGGHYGHHDRSDNKEPKSNPRFRAHELQQMLHQAASPLTGK
jgi:hypothetical protein